MDLTSKQRRHLRALAHHLNPIVMVGRAGLTDAVVRSVDEALAQHELIKVRIDAESPDDKHEVAEALAGRLHAAVAQTIGHLVVLYRRHPEKPQIELPDAPKIPAAQGDAATEAKDASPRGAAKRPLRTRRKRDAEPTPARGPRRGS